MKLLKYILPIMAILFCSSSIFAQIETDTQEIESEPFEELEEAERRAAAEATPGVSITGDVRLKWIPQSKKNKGFHTRGAGAQNPVLLPGAAGFATKPVGAIITAPTNFFQGEFNLYADYDGVKDWVETQVQFKNNLGIESGTSSGISLKKAWIGYSFYKACNSELYVELGRKGLSSIFDSRLQFDTNFDGILFTYQTEFDCNGKFLVHAGPLIVDYVVNHYAWIGEAFWDDIYGTQFWSKYALSWWKKNGVDRRGVHNVPDYRFIISQVMLGYDFDCEWVGKEACIYGAYVYNHAAKLWTSCPNHKYNQGWYVAIEYGKIGKPGDWLFDVCYQDVGYQAISNFDNSSIGRGNSASRGDTLGVVNPWTSSIFTDPNDVNNVPPEDSEGNTNFRGIEVRTYYSITSDITLRATSDFSTARNTSIGGDNRFIKFELTCIYDF